MQLKLKQNAVEQLMGFIGFCGDIKKNWIAYDRLTPAGNQDIENDTGQAKWVKGVAIEVNNGGLFIFTEDKSIKHHAYSGFGGLLKRIKRFFN